MWALPPVRDWFLETFETPTRAQREGWPAIASGRHTLICAPTGTGKTLAAFLAGLNLIWKASPCEGVKILYVSPLKALNSDVAVNLEVPLSGIVKMAERMRTPLRPLSVGVRTGDTSPSERRLQLKRPPDILITTPESLHLILTSRQRETLGTVSHVIVDEIHELCSRKRGVSLAILLERLSRLTTRDCVRIGLSATLNPVEEVGAFLGGWNTIESASGRRRNVSRPVSIIDAGSSQSVDLTVRSINRSASTAEGHDLDHQLLDQIRAHRSTLIFVNHRAEVERLTTRLNALLSQKKPSQDAQAARTEIRSHHGSLSLEQRRETEAFLKEGSLAAVVATASLELGIDIGSIDQVCQVGSPGSVARGLQRVGRAGHSVTEVTRACLFARTDSERLELVALADAMREGVVEPLRLPERCLDVLAQQILACVAIESWEVHALFEFIKQAHPYRNLSWEEFEAVLTMLSGRSSATDVRDLRARIHWDRVSQRLEPLPATQRLAVQGGNTIPDTGQLPVVLDGGTRLGELDEDFVIERRVGDVIQLGTSTWVIRSIDSKRVLVGPAEGRSAIVPFWRGEGLGRSGLLGSRLGALRRSIESCVKDDACGDWVAERFELSNELSRQLVAIIRRQIESVGCVPTDEQVLVESFHDESSLLNVLIQTPLGSRFHLALKFLIQGWHRDRLGFVPVCYHADDGLLIQLPGMTSLNETLFNDLCSASCESTLIRELWESPLFQLRFRQVTNRALPMVGVGLMARAPLWFQRHRAERLFEAILEDPDHPLIRETIRECLSEDLDLAGLQTFLQKLGKGHISVETVPLGMPLSPFASELFHQISGRLRTQTRRPSRRRGRFRAESFRKADVLEPSIPELVIGSIEPSAVDRVNSRLRGRTYPPRTAEEMAELLRFCGDFDENEINQSLIMFLKELRNRGLALRIEIDGATDPLRWITSEALLLYETAFDVECLDSHAIRSKGENLERFSKDQAGVRIVQSYVRSHAVVTLDQIVARYGIPVSRTQRILNRLARSGEVISLGRSSETEPERWVERRNLDDLQRFTMALRRKESISVDPETFAEVLLRHHCLDQASQVPGPEVQEPLLRRLAGFPAPIAFWETDVLLRRMNVSNPSVLDQFLRTEQWHWRCVLESGNERFLTLVPPDFPGPWTVVDSEPLSSDAEILLSLLHSRGNLDTDELVAISKIDPRVVKSSLEELWTRGFVGGDRLDPIRGADRVRRSPTPKSRGTWSAGGSRPRRGGVRSGGWGCLGVKWVAFARSDALGFSEGASLEDWVRVLLDRYGVLCKETAKLDRWAPSWSSLREALDLAELRGEVRRGYFVSGLSGVQFATESFIEALRTPRKEDQTASPLLISAIDPANLYGVGAPFSLPAQEGSGIRFTRSTSNHLVLLNGRPLILSENYARRLTVLPWANDEAIEKALSMFRDLAGPGRCVLKVQEINGQPALESRYAEPLLRAGFVRNPPGMAYYAGWSHSPSA
ncbi:DEAD/DEAH box helicase [Tautonia marina]|uniref:DEAD/DEAH box helicase n=1 Tax=Tautonia marina TaxID=2653855 RepID=UPI0012605EDF|nr:DEAD/DEAH box helicase [Tautonia marina]